MPSDDPAARSEVARLGGQAAARNRRIRAGTASPEDDYAARRSGRPPGRKAAVAKPQSGRWASRTPVAYVPRTAKAKQEDRAAMAQYQARGYPWFRPDDIDAAAAGKVSTQPAGSGSVGTAVPSAVRYGRRVTC